MDEIAIAPRSVDLFAQVLGVDRLTQFSGVMDLAREHLAGRTLWHVNSTPEGGGVAEMLHSILGYPLDAGISIRWLVIDGNEAFFEVTKRMHHLLHGRPGDHGPLGPAEKRIYDSALAADASRLADLIQPGDPIILHDPQTLGLAPALQRAGAHVVWICHIGADQANQYTRTAWQFLARYIAHTDHQVFSRPQYAWPRLQPARVATIPPCIDAFSPKNQMLDDRKVAAILDAAAIIPTRTDSAQAAFTRQDQTRGRVTNRASMIEDEPLPAAAPLVTQISRWDPLKDHLGVLTGFCTHGPTDADAHLVLAGPDPQAISDDPEGRQTLTELQAARDALDPATRRRVHIARLPMADIDENAAIVNALQRRADVVVQKSLAEGFGLTVAEAMWKERPTVASRVGGIQDQIEPDLSGLLVEPTDLAQFGATLSMLLTDRDTAASLGRAAHQRVCREYLAPHHLERILYLIADASINR